MPLGTVDRAPPPFFRQGPSALSKLMVLSALAVLLMVVDVRLHWAAPLRSAMATALYPLQWLATQPFRLTGSIGEYIGSLSAARQDASEARAELTRQAQRAALVEHLSQENRELRSLLGMQVRLPHGAQGASVLFEAADIYSRKLILNRGQLQNIVSGSAVMDGYGVIGQVTRVYPATAEVTLLIDRHQTIPVLNTRTGLRSLAVGEPNAGGGQLHLRFVAANSDTQPGDILTTSGVDGVYPAGLPVARVLTVSHQGEAGFARIVCEPMARLSSAMHVLVVAPQAPLRRAPPEEAKP
ncbi:MAG TPA: rod shape-determining protein MreC [Macromonas sp.]|nr:rod shape-determining protein MreC [Macromonas sp.]